MKITIIKNLDYSPQAEPELLDVVTEAESRGHEAEIINLNGFNSIEEQIEQAGDVIFYRTSGLTPGLREGFLGRTLFLRLLQDKVIINSKLMEWPHLTYKLVQQKLVAAKTDLNTIPTWHFRSVEELHKAIGSGTLSFPLIQKPLLGAKGNGVKLIENKESLAGELPSQIESVVYQPYIQNSGDFRIIMLGGVFMGAILRRSPDGSVLNNISQGAEAEVVRDRKLLRDLHLISGKVGSVFDLSLYGLDLMYDARDNKIYFLEVNAPPQWKGFEASTGLSVSGAFVDLCEDLYDRKKKRASKLIRNYYQRHAHTMTEKKQFHWHSRLWLWTGDAESRKQLDQLKGYYIGEDEDSMRRKIAWHLRATTEELYESINFQKERAKLFEVYPKLINYEQLLLLILFSKTVYGMDIGPLVREQIEFDEIVAYRDRLQSNPGHIATLASFAVNYLYLTETIVGSKRVSPEFLYDVATRHGDTKEVSQIKLQMYLLLHCIIGESQFYSQRVERDLPIYTNMLKYVEQRFFTHYHQISTDLKFEFLVCAALCNYSTKLKSIMVSEGEQSLSPIGNFIVDAYNDNRRTLRRVLNSSEHANILYTMAKQKRADVSQSTS